ncbi:MAG TPA: cysteine desulfurase-like protein [Gemmatimonadaceae bacterium]|nr:cysteine desulfurase-like protein [Gemmatimonadaceae bacterium]
MKDDMNSIITVASADEIRARFPAMRRVHNGHAVAYFDGPGGTQVPQAVADAMADYLLHHNANTHWAYPTSAETDAMIAAARAALADFVNGAPEEIAFGQNMTSLTFHLARGLGRAWGPGDEIVVTELDHHANIAPWQALAAERGVTVRTARMRTEDGTLDMGDLARQVNAKTRLVAVGAASNALGTISDVRAAAEIAHAHGALAFVDAVHYAPHQLVDVQALGCDFLACSAYKFYGPHIGLLWGRRALIERTDVPRLAPAPQESPERLETGTQNHEAIAGAAAAVEFLAGLAPAGTPGGRRGALTAAFDALHARAMTLFERLWTGLETIPGVTLYGPRPGRPRTPTLSFTKKGEKTTAIARRLAVAGLFVSNGDYYAATVMERLGLAEDGTVRIGLSCYSTEHEVERLLAEIAGN